MRELPDSATNHPKISESCYSSVRRRENLQAMLAFRESNS